MEIISQKFLLVGFKIPSLTSFLIVYKAQMLWPETQISLASSAGLNVTLSMWTRFHSAQALTRARFQSKMTTLESVSSVMAMMMTWSLTEEKLKSTMIFGLLCALEPAAWLWLAAAPPVLPRPVVLAEDMAVAAAPLLVLAAAAV